MSIPDRFYRIARHKLGEVKDWFDKVDEEEEADARQARRANPRDSAARELSDSLAPTGSASGNAVNGSTGVSSRGASSNIPVNTPRTPQDYTRGARSVPPVGGYGTNTGGGAPPPNGNSSTSYTQPDPLDYHYKLLGLEPGADFPAVQAAYNKLAARSDPSRFPAGSPDAQSALQIRQRLDTSYKTLRDALDSTAARFGLLEFDDEPTEKKEEQKTEDRRQ